MIYQLRDYQQESSDAAASFFQTKNDRNGLLVLPTGAGKSLVIADIAFRLGAPLLVLQPSREILSQNYAKLKSYGVDDCSVYSASLNSKKISRITFATIGSIMAHIDDFDHFKYIIVDEAHCVNASQGQYKQFFDKVKRKILGLTATPYRLSTALQYLDRNGKQCFRPKDEEGSQKFDERIISHDLRMETRCVLKFLTRTRPRVFHDVVYQVDISTLLSRGYLAKVEYFDLSIVDQSRLRRNSTGMDFDDKSLQNEYKQTNFSEYLLEIVLRLLHPKSGQNRRGILVFAKSIEECQQLCKRLPSCAVVTGSTPKKERDEILENFKLGCIDVLVNVGVLTCLSSDTEILTRNKGWVGVNEIAQTDLVAQYDENGHISFVQPNRIIVKDFDGDFAEINGRHLNARVTSDHTMLYGKRNSKGNFALKKCLASELVGKSVFIPVSGECPAEDIVPTPPSFPSKKRFINYNSYNYRKKGYSPDVAKLMAENLYASRLAEDPKAPAELSLDECRFIGFWLGDGSMWKSCDGGIRYNVCQSNANPQMVIWLESLMDSIGIRYSKHCVNPSNEVLGRNCHVSNAFQYSLAKGTGGDTQRVKTALTKLLPYLHKEGSDLYWGLSSEQFFALVEGFHKANGSHGDNRKFSQCRITSSNKRLLDLLQAIAVCRGFSSSICICKPRKTTKTPLYRFWMSIKKKAFHGITNERFQHTKSMSNERVWCVTMPEGTIVTRRNGKVMIMGNCGFDYPELDTVVMARPTMSLALYYQIIGRGIRPHPSKKSLWFVDLCGNIKRFGKVEDLHLAEPNPGEYIITGCAEGATKQLTNIYF
jgi:DNA repair protein RadD